MNELILDVKNLAIAFGENRVVDDVSFKIRQGETLSLVGESGSGKSMSALAIMRLLPTAARIQGGKVTLFGRELLSVPEQRMRSIRGGDMGMIFQEPMTSLNPVIKVGEQIAESLRVHHKLSRSQAKLRAIELLDQVGIVNPVQRSQDYPHLLSGGMKQRVMIATALAGKPKLLIADEPTTALDVTIQAQVLDLIKDLQREQGTAVLFITHDLAVVSQVADEVVVMRQGQVLEQGSAKTFFANPQHEYSRELFDALPSFDKRGKSLQTGEQQNADAPVNSDVVLSVDDLKIYFPIRKGLFKRTVGHVKAVDGVSFELKKGQTLALVGESGSGKTTIGRGILKLNPATSGELHYEQKNIAELDYKQLLQYRSDVQVVFQDPYSSMNPRMLIGEIIAEGMIALDICADKTARDQRIQSLLEQVGLPEDAALRYPHEFSGGQRQRICIARALAVDPKVLILDEPTSALDVSVQAQILDLLYALQQQLGLSYLFITHNISVVAYFAHDVIVMQQGKLVEQGSVQQVLQEPRDPYTQQLLAAVPRVRRA